MVDSAEIDQISQGVWKVVTIANILVIVDQYRSNCIWLMPINHARQDSTYWKVVPYWEHRKGHRA